MILALSLALVQPLPMGSGITPPVSGSFIATELDEPIITEAGDNLVTE